MLKSLDREEVKRYRDGWQCTALHWVSKYGKDPDVVSEMIRYLVEEVGLAVNERAGLKALFQTALFFACYGVGAAVVALLELQADIDHKDDLGQTPLFYCAKHANVDCVKELLARRADTFLRDKYGQSAVFQAVVLKKIQRPAEDRLKCLEQLIAAGGSRSTEKDEDGREALYYAALNDAPGDQCCKKLLEDRCDVNHADVRKQTPLFGAAEANNLPACKLLLMHGAMVNYADKHQETALFKALKRNHEQTCKYLLEAKADFEKKNAANTSPLDFALDARRSSAANPKTLDYVSEAVLSLFRPLKEKKDRERMRAATNGLPRKDAKDLVIKDPKKESKKEPIVVPSPKPRGRPPLPPVAKATPKAKALPKGRAAAKGKAAPAIWPRAAENRPRSSLHGAAFEGPTEKLRRLLEERADPNEVEEGTGHTPLHWAVLGRAREHVHILVVEFHCAVDRQDASGKTAQDLALAKWTEGSTLLAEKVKEVKFLKWWQQVKAQKDAREAVKKQRAQFLENVSSAAESQSLEDLRGLLAALPPFTTNKAERLQEQAAILEEIRALVKKAPSLNFELLSEQFLGLATRAYSESLTREVIEKLISPQDFVEGYMRLRGSSADATRDLEEELPLNLPPLHAAARRSSDEEALEALQLLLPKMREMGFQASIQDHERRTALFVGARTGRADVCAYLLQSACDANLPDRSGRTPLFDAAELGHDKALEVLLKHGAQPGCQSKGGRTALMVSIASVAKDENLEGKMRCFELLLEAHCPVNAVDGDGFTALLLAVQHGQREVVHKLLIVKADVHQTDATRRTALAVAMEKGHQRIAQVLLGCRARPPCEGDPPLPEGLDLVQLARDQGMEELVPDLQKAMEVRQLELSVRERLLQAASHGKDNDVNEYVSEANDLHPEVQESYQDPSLWMRTSNELGSTVLHCAAQRTDPYAKDVLDYLLACHADPNALNRKGETPLFEAVRKGTVEITRRLFQQEAYEGAPAPADVNAQARTGETALFVAAALGRTEMITLLIESGANVKHRCCKGRTAVFAAASAGKVDALRRLLELEDGPKAADIDLQGHTPLFNTQDVESLKLLLEHRADVTAKDQKGYTALHFASVKASAALLQAKADVNARNCQQKTPLFLAVEENNVAKVKVLLGMLSNVHHVDKEGKTAFHIAAEKASPEMVRLLYTAGFSNPLDRGGIGKTPLELAESALAEADLEPAAKAQRTAVRSYLKKAAAAEQGSRNPKGTKRPHGGGAGSALQDAGKRSYCVAFQDEDGNQVQYASQEYAERLAKLTETIEDARWSSTQPLTEGSSESSKSSTAKRPRR